MNIYLDKKEKGIEQTETKTELTADLQATTNNRQPPFVNYQ